MFLRCRGFGNSQGLFHQGNMTRISDEHSGDES
jgi:hypothetical protein